MFLNWLLLRDIFGFRVFKLFRFKVVTTIVEGIWFFLICRVVFSNLFGCWFSFLLILCVEVKKFLNV